MTSQENWPETHSSTIDAGYRDGHADVLAARLEARRAIMELGSQAGAPLSERPAFPGAQLTVRDLDPMAGLQAARQIELAARHAARDYVRQARQDGASWHEIGKALDLSPGADPDQAGTTLAEAAYTYVAGRPDTDTARRYGREFIWTCPSCNQVIGDSGPCIGPAEDERGHSQNCQRLAETTAAWDAQREAGE